VKLLGGDPPEARPRRFVVQEAKRHGPEGTPPPGWEPARNTSFTKTSRRGRGRLS
jgi:hypothetical protein